MDAASIASILKPMNSTQIINTLTALKGSGVDVASLDVPAVLSQLNVTQIEGLLSTNSSTVDGLLQSLNSTQLVTILYNFQNVTSTLFKAGAASNNTVAAQNYFTHGKTLVGLLLNKLSTVFTDAQLAGVFSVLSNGAAPGTGAKKLMNAAKGLLGGFFGGVDVGASNVEVPPRLLHLVQSSQPAIFGDYPTTKDIAPSAIFMAIFIIFTFIHLGIFIKNYTLGHKFFVSLGLAIYSICRFLGFVLRLVWAKNPLKLDVGITSTIFIVIPTVFLPSLNLILAQRYFTWKHPVYGTHRIFTTFMYVIYAAVVAVVVMTIVAAAVRTDYFLNEHHFTMTKQVIQASAILIIIYSLIASILVALAFVIPQSKGDEQILTIQPYWIKSFKWNYFVTKNAAQKELDSVPEEQRHAISVINSSAYHHDSVNKESTEASTTKLDHSFSIVIISLTTFVLFVADIFRCVSTFIDQVEVNHSWIFDPVVMYVLFGALEVLVNVLYVLGRIDLRFYRPDSFKNAAQPSKTDAAPVQSSTESNNDEKASNEASV